MNSPSQKRVQPVALTLAGSDSGGNAGIQADLRAMHAFGVHGCTAIAALTAQNPSGVRGVFPVTTAFLTQQLKVVFAAYAIGAVKTGMLLNAGLIEAAATVLAAHPTVPKVVDPVMIATSGACLLNPDAVAVLIARLLPLATVITPNLPEAAALLGRPMTDAQAAGTAARELAARFGCAVLVKGGHDANRCATDAVCIGQHLYRLTSPVVRQPLSLHGTGCTLSAALAAALASGLPLLDAVVAAKGYVYNAIRTGRVVGPATTVLGSPARRAVACVAIERWHNV